MKPNSGYVKSRSNAVIAASCHRHVVFTHPNCGSWRSYEGLIWRFMALTVLLWSDRDYASAMHPSQNSSCPSALGQSVSLDVSSPIPTQIWRPLSTTHTRVTTSCVCVCVVCYPRHSRINSIVETVLNLGNCANVNFNRLKLINWFINLSPDFIVHIVPKLSCSKMNLSNLTWHDSYHI